MWSKGSTFASFIISNQDIVVTKHSVATVVPKTFGRSLERYAKRDARNKVSPLTFSSSRFTFLCDTRPSWSFPKTLK